MFRQTARPLIALVSCLALGSVVIVGSALASVSPEFPRSARAIGARSPKAIQVQAKDKSVSRSCRIAADARELKGFGGYHKFFSC